MAIAFDDFVIFHSRDDGLGVLVADHCHLFSSLFLYKKMLVNVSEKVQFHVCHFKNILPGQTRKIVIRTG